MSKPTFWADAQKRTAAVLKEETRFRQAVRDRNFVWARHIFVKMRAPTEHLCELFSTGGVVISSSDLKQAFLGLASFSNSLNGYTVIAHVFANEGHRLGEFVEQWHASLEGMLALCKQKQQEVAVCN